MKSKKSVFILSKNSMYNSISITHYSQKDKVLYRGVKIPCVIRGDMRKNGGADYMVEVQKWWTPTGLWDVEIYLNFLVVETLKQKDTATLFLTKARVSRLEKDSFKDEAY